MEPESKKRSLEEETTSQSNTTNNSNNNNNMDSFLASMTFAGTGPHLARGGCDCDECGGAGGLLPQTIIEAIRAHKRVKAETGPMKRTQQRELLSRHTNGASVYRMTMPVESEPLVEYGSTHRLVWIQTLSSNAKLLAIGKGVVGSQDEERGRQELKEWTEGRVFLVPSNGGKAIAWVHSANNKTEENTETTNTETDTKEEKKDARAQDETISTTGGHAILYVCKIPKDSLESIVTSEGEHEDNQEWHQVVLEICKSATDNFVNENTENEKGLQYQKLTDDNASRLKDALSHI